MAVGSEKHRQRMLEWKWKGVELSDTLNMWFRSWLQEANLLLAGAACVDQVPINTTKTCPHATPQRSPSSPAQLGNPHPTGALAHSVEQGQSASDFE